MLEAMGCSTRKVVTFADDHFFTVTGEQSRTTQAPDPTTDDDYFCFYRHKGKIVSTRLFTLYPMFADPRDYQILFLATFLSLGIGTRDWSIRPELIATLIITCCLTQWILSKQINPTDHPWLSLKSALITSLGLSLLLRADRVSTMVLAGFLAIGSKFILSYAGKHWFNPANFGIILALLIAPDTWVSPGQWGDDWWYLLLFVGTGAMVLKRVGRWDTSAAFLVAYALLEALRNLWLGWTWDVYAHKLMSGSLLLFALFMITDPRSIPNARSARIVWAIAIALLAFILRNYFYLNTALFIALFIASPLTPLLDQWWSSPPFTWGGKSRSFSG
jgi:Na+-transporting NADH:ubiquinone oxidoreductase subunit NqrB